MESAKQKAPLFNNEKNQSSYTTDSLQLEEGLKVPIGRTETGELLLEDLSDTTHLLVCGCTGSGKSAFVKTLISMAIKKSPKEVGLMIFDSNTLEYMDFSNLPQLLYPIAKELNDGEKLILTARGECKKRLTFLHSVGYKDVASYNELCKKTEESKEIIKETFLILDDFSQLVLSNVSKEALFELLRNGRAAGVHVIAVTSNLANDTFRKNLLSNIPYRAVFCVLSKAESKLVLEQYGAESLQIPGEMFLKKQGEIIKCQCAYAEDNNIHNFLTATVKNSSSSIGRIGKAVCSIFNTLEPKGTSEKTLQKEYDPLITEAVSIAINNRQITTGTLQRAFRISYKRANEIVEQLSQLGVISPVLNLNSYKTLITAKEWNSNCEKKGLEAINEEKIVINTEVPREIAVEKNKSESNGNIEPPDIEMRDFPKVETEGQIIEIKDNKIKYHVKFRYKMYRAWGDPEFNGKVIEKIIVRKPTVLSKGYVKFIFKPHTNINTDDVGKMIGINETNVSEYTKLRYGNDLENTISLFVKQISEDCNVEVVEV